MRISDWSSDVCSSDLQPATPRITTLADAANATVINPVVAEDSPGAVADSSANADTPAPRTHVVARGDSIWRLAEHYGVSRADLLERNGLSPNAVLHPGTVLEIDHAPAPVPDARTVCPLPETRACPNQRATPGFPHTPHRKDKIP